MQISPTTYPPLCIAHRGFSAKYPENSTSAFDAALQAPIQGIELDVQLSKDNQLVIYHNRSLRMVGGGMKRIRNQDLASMQRYDYGRWFHPQFAGEPLLLLGELLERYGGRTHLLIELKIREPLGSDRLEILMRRTQAEIVRLNLKPFVSILCFDLELLRLGHSLEPDIRYVWNQSKGPILAREHDFLFAYSLRHNLLSPEFVAEIQAAGKPVFSFTCDSPRLYQKSVQCGVNGIMANDPVLLAQRLATLPYPR